MMEPQMSPDETKIRKPPAEGGVLATFLYVTEDVDQHMHIVMDLGEVMTRKTPAARASILRTCIEMLEDHARELDAVARFS